MFKLIGTKWGNPTFGTPSGTINWEADLGNLDSTTTTGALNNALDDAFDRWEAVTNVTFSEGSGSSAVSIGTASFSNDSNDDNDDAAATASWTLSGGSIQPQNATITFNTDLEWAPTGNGGVDFFAVALHEIGHIIGLDHPTENDENPDEIMNPVVRAEDLGDGDIEGVREIYGEEGDSGGGGGGGLQISGGGDGGGGGGAIGLVAGLLALVFGLFTGGAGAIVAMAAARVSDDDDGDGVETEVTAAHGLGCTCADCCMQDHDHSDHDHVVTLPDGSIQMSHVTYVDLPEIDFDHDSFGAGDEEDGENSDEYFFV